MRRLLTASALFTLVLFATASSQEPAPYWERTVVGSDYPFPFQFARAQPQPGQPPKAVDDKKGDKKADKKPDPTDAAIAAALANDPDVRMAKAKIQLAEAELAKARQAVTFKIVALKGKMDQLKVEVRAAEDRVAWANAMFQKALIPQTQVLADRDKLETAKANLAAAESEWKLLTGAGAGVGFERSPGELSDRTVASALDWLARHAADKADPATAQSSLEMLKVIEAGYQAYQAKHAIKGPIPDRLRAALDKPVKLGAKGEKITFDKAMEVFKKEAGFDVPVRGSLPLVDAPDPKNPNEFKNQPIQIQSQGEELPVGAWLQLFEDTATIPHLGNGQPIHHRFYVREYGLLISDTRYAPPDAPSLTEFWKHKPPAAKDDPAPKK